MSFLDQPYNAVFPNSHLWEQVRKVCLLTASDFPAAVNCEGAYKSRSKLYKHKKGLEVEKESEMTKKLRENGHLQEELAIQWIQEQTDMKLYRPGFWIDEKDPRLGGSPDGLIHMGGTFFYVLEIKSPVKMIRTKENIKWRHIIQLYGLMHISGGLNGMLCYFKAGEEPSFFMVMYYAPVWEDIYSHIRTFLLCLERDQKPSSPAPKTFKKGSYARTLNNITFDFTDIVKTISKPTINT